MDSKPANVVEEALFSFAYSNRTQASRCNSKIHQRFIYSLEDELEEAFNEVDSSGLQLELGKVEIDLGRITERELTEDLGELIKPLLILALKEAIDEQIGMSGAPLRNTTQSQGEEFILLALRSFFRNGYFPSWLDSKFDLFSLLDHAFIFQPELLRSLIWEVSRKSENARKRISFLKKGYFEKIIEVLIPEEAEWLIGFRNTYLNVHQKEKSFHGSSENLEQAVNLFILNFIVRNSDTKFNRLNFSNQFLRTVADHYNLDFHEFLLQLNRVIKIHKEESQLYRNFDEAVTWVIEKNLNSDEFIDSTGQQLSWGDLITWLNKKQNPSISTDFPELAEEKRIQTLQLLSKSPQYLSGLTKLGLDNLLLLLSKGETSKWLGLINEYSSWYARVSGKPKMKEEHFLKELIQHSSKEEVAYFTTNPSLDKLFDLMISFTSFKINSSRVNLEELVELGKRFSVPQPSLRFLKKMGFNQVKNSTSSNHWAKNEYFESKRDFYSESESIGSYSFQIKQRLIFEYLAAGSVGEVYYFLTKNDFSEILEAMIQSQNVGLFDFFKASNGKVLTGSNSRIWKLLNPTQTRNFLAYVAHFSGNKFKSLLEIHENLLESGKIKEGNRQRLDQKFIQVLILQGLFSPNSLVQDDSSNSIDWSDYLLELGKSSNFSDVLEIQKSRWSRVIELANQIPDLKLLKPEFQKSLLDLFKQSWSRNVGFGFLDFKSINSSFFANKGRNSKEILGQNLSLLSSEKELKNLIASLEGFSKSKEEDLVQWIKSKSDEVLLRDLNTIQKLASSGYNLGMDNNGLKESFERIVSYSQFDALSIVEFLKKNKGQSFYILLEFHKNLSEQSWKVFTQKLGSDFRREIETVEIYWDVQSYFNEEMREVDSSSQSFQNLSSLSINNLFNLIRKGYKKPDIKGLIQEEKEFYQGLDYLSNLPSAYFFDPISLRIWNKVIEDSTLQFHSKILAGQLFNQEDFGKILLNVLRKNRSNLGLSSIDWEKIVSLTGLTKVQKDALSQFYEDLIEESKQKQDQSIDSLVAVLGFFEKEGFLPWWSNWRTVEALFASTVHMIAYGNKEWSFLLLEFLDKGDLDTWINHIPTVQFEKLIDKLSIASNSNQAKSVVKKSKEILRQNALEKLDKLQKVDSKFREKNKLNLSNSELEREVKRAISYSKENEIIHSWFENDPKIQDQIKGLLTWSKEFYFGDLNPGKWKLYVLEFAYEYYFQQKNGFNSDFLKHLIQFLVSQKSSVKWKFIFGVAMKKRSFLKLLDQKQLQILQNMFPENSDLMQEEPEEGDQILVTNAGLILCWPFLKVLFSRLNVSAGNTIPEENQSKAVSLLQYLVFGYSDFPEYELVLNKMMVGMKPSSHLEEVELNQEEKDMCESLLKGMISNWEKLKNSTTDGLRETFLQRNGRLEIGSESNNLMVESKGVDVLMTSIPWSYSVVKLTWMEKSLEVKWN